MLFAGFNYAAIWIKIIPYVMRVIFYADAKDAFIVC